MRGQLNGGRGFGKGKLVRDEPARIQLPREDQPCHFRLQPKVRRVAADQVFLIHTHRCEIDGRLIAAPGVGE